ncbi:MAG TPA: DUF222 domain-containing protein [Acidimicrobiia bacterium]
MFESEPGPELAAFLSVVDPKELSGNDLVMVLQAHQRLASHFQARVYADIAALADVMFDFDQDRELANEATAMELRAALRLTRRSADIEIGFAQDLVNRLPRVAAEFEAGRVDVRRARVLIDETIHLTETQARLVVDEVIDRAGQLTTGELRSRVRKLCFAIEPEEAELRYETALEDRKLVQEPTVDGTANIFLTNIAPDKAAEALDRINQIARSLHTAGENRTMDQLRADIAIDLLCGNPTHSGTNAGNVDIHVDLETLARLNDDPGELAGYGPVIADIARQVAENSDDGEWRFRVTDPDSGLPVHMGATRKRAHNTHQKRQIELRDLVCATPGCRMPATDCDIDHSKTWADTGRTTIEDSAPGCRHDHVCRHKFDWTYQRLPDGDYLWTSRLGRHYTKSGRPPPQPG